MQSSCGLYSYKKKISEIGVNKKCFGTWFYLSYQSTEIYMQQLKKY